MPYTNEIDLSILGVAPAIVVYVRIETFCDIFLLACCKIVNAQTVAITLISVVSHALPSNILTVRREFWIYIVANIHVALLMVYSLVLHRLCCVNLRLLISFWFANVASLLSLHIIYIYVGICRDSIVHTFFLATGISYELRVDTPIKLLDTTKRSQRTFIWFTFKDVNHVGNTIFCYISNKSM